MASESEPQPEMQSVLERLFGSRNRDLSLFIPFIIGLSSRPDPDGNRAESGRNSTDPVENSENNSSPDDQNRERIILINTLTQSMVVIEGDFFRNLELGFPEKKGRPPASKASIEAMPSVEVREGERKECAICLDEFEVGSEAKEMPCKHRFHGGCIEKWLQMHGTCPVCRYAMPEETDERKEEGEGGERRREIWVSFFGGRPRRTEEEEREDENQTSSSGDQGSGGGELEELD